MAMTTKSNSGMPAPPAAGRPDPNKIVTPRGTLRDDAVEFAQRVLDQSDQVAALEARAARLEQQLAIATGELDAARRRVADLQDQLDDRNRLLERERDYYKARVVKITGQFEVVARSILDCLGDKDLVEAKAISSKAEAAGIDAIIRELGAPPPPAEPASPDYSPTEAGPRGPVGPS
jgi:septal ring factor EnvC (AmiA/AmiB activator)